VSLSIIWLSADPVARGAIGVTGRVEGVRYLVGQGHDVVMVCGAKPGQRPVEGVPTRFIPTRYIPLAGWLSLWPGVYRELAQRGRAADVVISDFAVLPPLMRWRRRCRRMGLPVPRVVLDIRTPPVESNAARLAIQRARFALTLKAYGRKVDAISTISDGLAEYVAGLAGVDPSSIVVWRSGSNWPATSPSQGGWPQELPADLLGRFLLIYHGNLAPRRGLAESIEAMARVGPDAPDATLVLLGSGSMAGDLKALAVRRGVADRVVLVDPVPHERVPEFLRVAGAGLVPLPHRWEWEVSSPVKLAEYLCAGLPVVLTDIAAHRILAPDAPYAFWAHSADPGDLAAAILRAYGERARLETLGREAKAWAAPRLAWSAQLSILERALERTAQQVVERKNHGPARRSRINARIAVVTNMWPYPERPAYGVFVAEQVRSLRAEPDLEVDAFLLQPLNSRGRYLRGGRVAAAIRAGGYDVVHCHHPFSLLALAPYLPWLRRQTILLTIHGPEGLITWRKWLTRVIAPLADEIVVTNEALRKSFGGHLMPCGIDTKTFHPNGQAPNARLRVVTVGEDRPEKQRWLATRAVEWAHAHNPDLAFEHEFVSGVPPASMPALYRHADVLLLSSRAEGSPMVVQESLASGLRVATTDVGDLRARYSEANGVHVAEHQSEEALGARLIDALGAVRRGRPFDAQVIRLEDASRDLAGLYRTLAARSRR
jgi:glycosyltransferase involved in cell wall biosynthesis